MAAGSPSRVHEEKGSLVAIEDWGVELTESDSESVELYRRWSSHAKAMEVISPPEEVAERLRALVSCDIKRFSSVTEWE